MFDKDFLAESKPLYKGAIFRNPDEEAKLFGLVAVHPKATELQLDIDTDDAYEIFLKRLCMLKKHYPVTYKVLPSKSDLPHRHITVTMLHREDSPLLLWERIALQAALGSDGNREMYNCIRALAGDEKPSVFFEKIL